MLQHEYQSLLDHQSHENKRAKSDDEIISKLPHLLQELRTRAAMYPQASDPAGEAYSSGLRAGYAEAQQRINRLQQVHQTPAELRVQLLQLADEFEQQVHNFPTGVGSLIGILGNLNQMMNKIGDGGKVEGYRQAAGIIRWFLGES